MLSFAGRVQLIKFVLSALQVYWAMAFILPKHIIKEIEKRLRNFLWKGNLDMGYAKVSWQQVCRPVSEGGLGIRDIHSLNKGLMSRHLWRIMHDSTSIWVHWILQYRLRDSSVWTIRTQTGTWGWRKLIRLRDSLRPHVLYQIGDGTSFSLWHDPWHPGGPMICQFPSGPRHTFIPPSAPLSTVIWEDTWSWPHITDMESIDITHDLPTIQGRDRILWTGPRGSFSSAAAYDVFRPPGPTVGWTSLLVGSAYERYGGRFTFIGHIITGPQSFGGLRYGGAGGMWLMPRTGHFLLHLSIICGESATSGSFSIRHALLREIVRIVVTEIRDLIICKQLPRTVSTRGLYRLWRIPWPVEAIVSTICGVGASGTLPTNIGVTGGAVTAAGCCGGQSQPRQWGEPAGAAAEPRHARGAVRAPSWAAA
ncbi:UNVERIFIED_CONTAM: hypothetical protein Sradi_6838100 [Sesamum radiatum]|uniref:Reverse transcriptase zinc-binding domain-containing protein n=1 Tax=Sesamum radiatum TaxID=300843 RepID=A0AAW2JNZ2_SESRA